MLKKTIQVIAVVSFIMALTFSAKVSSTSAVPVERPILIERDTVTVDFRIEPSNVVMTTAQAMKQIEFVQPETILSEEEIDLLAILTMAEAEGESERGKRLVIDTVLNRIDSEHFPDTVIDVIYQKNQFTSMWNGRFKRCYVREDIRQLVVEELMTRTDHDVIFFRTGRYSTHGSPMFREGAHYFSSYN